MVLKRQLRRILTPASRLLDGRLVVVRAYQINLQDIGTKTYQHNTTRQQ
jgi:hypothetical protein